MSKEIERREQRRFKIKHRAVAVLDFLRIGIILDNKQRRALFPLRCLPSKIRKHRLIITGKHNQG